MCCNFDLHVQKQKTFVNTVNVMKKYGLILLYFQLQFI